MTIYVLDTNVLIHDPTSIFRFEDNNVYIPMPVLEELDSNKKGDSEKARNARQASRFLDELITEEGQASLPGGGVLVFQLVDSMESVKGDNAILAAVIELKELCHERGKNIVLVSKDINMRIKAISIGITTEDYTSDTVLEDMDLLYRGFTHTDLSLGDWLKSTKSQSQYLIEDNSFSPNEFLCLDNYIVRYLGDNVVEDVIHYKDVWGISPKNEEQNLAFNLLMNPDIYFVSLTGVAGTGKTLLALAAAFEQTVEKGLYKEIIMTREVTPLGNDIGFLPGTETEKMSPWMGALLDNMEVLVGENAKEVGTQDLLNKYIKIKATTFLRGRTFLKRYLIIDEAQNLSPRQVKALVTRAGLGTKVVMLGNVSQIDNPYLTPQSCGLTYAVERFKKWEHSGHLIFSKGERSPLADYANEEL